MNRSFYGNIKKLDAGGKVIKVWKGWIKEHPGELYFDSALEYVVYNYLKDNNIKFVYQPESIVFYPSKEVEEIKDVTKKGVKSTVIKNTKQKSISYTPDFYLPDEDIWLETKGYLKEDSFRLRWRLFKNLGYKGFIVRNLKDMELIIEHLKSNDNE